jgi:hypothetical protein
LGKDKQGVTHDDSYTDNSEKSHSEIEKLGHQLYTDNLFSSTHLFYIYKDAGVI